jgi:hypothetical protein
VVTMNVDGKAVVQSDERMHAYEFKSVPNYEHTLVARHAPSVFHFL